jgi:quinol monooxygenase YgiN
MITVRFRMQMNPKNRNELLNAVRNISQEVRKEDGCLGNLVFQSLEDENELIMIESWKSKVLLKKHWKTLNFSALLGFQNLLSKPMDVEVGKISGTQGIIEIEKARTGKRPKQLNKGIKIKAGI